MQGSTDWILGGVLDFEYKKYRLLAYFQRIEQSLKQSRLFPALPEMRFYQHSLEQLRRSKQGLQGAFPRAIKGIKRDPWRLEYVTPPADLPALETVDAIIDFSLPHFGRYIAEAEGILDLVESKTTLYPVGIVPLYVDEGYLIVRTRQAKAANVYQYTARVLQSTELAGAIRTSFVGSYPWRISSTMEQLKALVRRARPELPNPAAYAVESELEVPEHETLLPVATKLLGHLLQRG